MSSITFAVQGMSCGGCSGKVKRALEALEGVSATEVVLESGAVTVQYDAPATPESFRETVEDLGFDVVS
ncbi:heavy-metal-associated domain-containing protein [Stutzerimonas kirkiae]|uniref:heavy-metal-associated domain-containing protein n=1 Tax=Stutzerimonas kirkiae TaxID=2211392 RepID=UPI0010384971|nr:heavy metal-associated domain-containing protein [Stutzerimonas kirkiae]TBV10745.1 copper resistance protein CopZ [Stutzerimonas kirkiae]TBV14537.1 copper resistance protein CopZ [Stutzerimonas kirkiae]